MISNKRLILTIVPLLFFPIQGWSQSIQPFPENPENQPRLVVFEEFSRPT